MPETRDPAESGLFLNVSLSGDELNLVETAAFACVTITRQTTYAQIWISAPKMHWTKVQ